MADNTLFHVTHWKAGSQWIYNILQEVVPDKIVHPEVGERQFFIDKILPGKVYPTVYITKEQFQFRNPPPDSKLIVVCRDLRDTLISAYYSIKYSHALLSEALGSLRARLHELNEEDGLLFVAEKWLPACATIQASWKNSEQEIIWYEDLLENDTEILERHFLKNCKLDVSAQQLIKSIQKNRFSISNPGRNCGEEDKYNHQRKGQAGDWRNHFTQKISRRFDEIYGNLSKESFLDKKIYQIRYARDSAASTISDAEVLQAYDQLSALFSNVPSYVVWLAWECAAFKKHLIQGHFLDYGCADGRLAKYVLDGAERVSGVAPSSMVIDTAMLYGPYDQVGNFEWFESLDENATYDGIFSRGSLTQTSDLPGLLKKFHKHIKPGGFLLCSVLSDRFNQESGVATILRMQGYPDLADQELEKYKAFHGIKNAMNISDWKNHFADAGFSVTSEIPIVPNLPFHLFSFIDGLWHTQMSKGGELGDVLAAHLATNNNFSKGFRSILSGILEIDHEPTDHAGYVVLASKSALF